MSVTPPQDQCRNEFLGLLHRWIEESDLTEFELLEACNDAVVHYFNEPVVEFTPDDDFLELIDEPEPPEPSTDDELFRDTD